MAEENAWKPVKDMLSDEEKAQTNDLFKKMKALLDKLTPNNFDMLKTQAMGYPIDTEERLKGIADLVFEKAINESAFSKTYAKLFRDMSELKVPADSGNGMVQFRTLIINRCQKEFEKERSDEQEKIEREKIAQLPEIQRASALEDLKIKLIKNKKCMLGTIRFIGELFMQQMIIEQIMHDCIYKLLCSRDDESLECIVHLLITIGKTLDHDKAKKRMDQYFTKFRLLHQKMVSDKIRFMLQHVLELRMRNWVPLHTDDNHKTIEQILEGHKQEEEQKILEGIQAKAQLNAPPPRMSCNKWDQPLRVGPPPNKGCNTVSSKAAKVSADPNKFKVTKQQRHPSPGCITSPGIQSRASPSPSSSPNNPQGLAAGPTHDMSNQGATPSHPGLAPSPHQQGNVVAQQPQQTQQPPQGFTMQPSYILQGQQQQLRPIYMPRSISQLSQRGGIQMQPAPTPSTQQITPGGQMGTQYIPQQPFVVMPVSMQQYQREQVYQQVLGQYQTQQQQFQQRPMYAQQYAQASPGQLYQQPGTPPYYTNSPPVSLQGAFFAGTNQAGMVVAQAPIRQTYPVFPQAPQYNSNPPLRKKIIGIVDPKSNKDITDTIIRDAGKTGTASPHSGQSSASDTPPSSHTPPQNYLADEKTAAIHVDFVAKVALLAYKPVLETQPPTDKLKTEKNVKTQAPKKHESTAPEITIQEGSVKQKTKPEMPSDEVGELEQKEVVMIDREDAVKQDIVETENTKTNQGVEDTEPKESLKDLKRGVTYTYREGLLGPVCKEKQEQLPHITDIVPEKQTQPPFGQGLTARGDCRRSSKKSKKVNQRVSQTIKLNMAEENAWKPVEDMLSDEKEAQTEPESIGGDIQLGPGRIPYSGWSQGSSGGSIKAQSIQDANCNWFMQMLSEDKQARGPTAAEIRGCGPTVFGGKRSNFSRKREQANNEQSAIAEAQKIRGKWSHSKERDCETDMRRDWPESIQAQLPVEETPKPAAAAPKLSPHVFEKRSFATSRDIEAYPVFCRKRELTNICLYFLRGICKHDADKYNHKRHFKSPYQWQFLDTDVKDAKWQNIPSPYNDTVERAFCDPENGAHDLTIAYGSVEGRYGCLFFDRTPMRGSTEEIHIRRLTTSSSILKSNWKKAFSTEWIWYWQDERDKWIMYSEQNMKGTKAGIDSAVIEQKYLDYERNQGDSSLNFTAADQTYTLDFVKLTQTNVRYRTVREVRRRPEFVLLEDRKRLSRELSQSQSSEGNIPTTWNLMMSLDNLKLVTMTDFVNPECVRVANLFWDTMDNKGSIVSIQRIQNKELWEDFSRMKEGMIRRNGGVDVHQKQLFHGTTTKQLAKVICHENFDPSRSGSNVGTLHGKGTYFARDASLAHSYTTADTNGHRCVFVAQVLVGSFTVGDKDYTQPPPKHRTTSLDCYDSCVNDVSNPGIYVIFEKSQMYPEYLITYKVKSSHLLV